MKLAPGRRWSRRPPGEPGSAAGLRLLVVVAVLAASACERPPDPAVVVQSLDGAWQLHQVGDSSWLPATVPGTVHTDLLAAGRIPDPLSGDHEAELQWIEDADWIYRLGFDADPDLLKRDRTELVFDGLDTYATVTLNGRELLRADNQFRTWRVDVAGVLRAGTNTLEVRFDSPIREGRARAEAAPWPIPHQEPDSLGTRAFTRKAAYQYGWDWGPRYVTSGIWRPVRLEAWSGVRIRDTWGRTLRNRSDTVTLLFTVDVEAAGDVAARSTLRLGIRSPDGAFEPVVEDFSPPPPGEIRPVTAALRFPSPELWWPRGAGHGSPHLYDVDVDLVQGDHWDRSTTQVGLRTVALVTEPDSVGESFLFRINGQPVFMRGANVVPPDHFTPRADSAVYARLIDDAAAAHMNMLRVWGGGVYLPEVFYDLADRAGILVWQDFMFANALVPGDSAFAASVAAEADDQVRRLRHHPSLALWCGNNEIAEGWANWGWRDEYSSQVASQVDGAYRKIFDDILPATVARLDPGTPYRPSSPSIGWGHPESLERGDSHYWGVWWGMEPFRAYARKVPRFASEFGFQALPDPATLKAFADSTASGAGGPASLHDPLMRAHEKHPTGYRTIRAYLERRWPVPPDDSLDAWSYVSQLAQADGVGLALEAHRRSWPRTGGTLFWQLNDTWPVVSWSSVDALGRWKALQYRAERIFSSPVVLADAWADTVAVWVEADRSVSGYLQVRVVDFDGHELARREATVQRSGLAWRGTRADLLPPGTDPGRVYVWAGLDVADNAFIFDYAFLAPPRDLLLPDPHLRVVSAEPDGEAWKVVVESDRFAYGVRISADGVPIHADWNYFHLDADSPVEVRVMPERPTPDLPERLRLRSLADLLAR